MRPWTRVTLTLSAALILAGGCAVQPETGRGIRTTAQPGDFEFQDQPILTEPTGQAPNTTRDPDDLLKYIDIRLHPYLAEVRREPDGHFLLIFKGSLEAIDLPRFRDLMEVELKEVESHSILIVVRERTTLRVSLHPSPEHQGGIVEIRPPRR